MALTALYWDPHHLLVPALSLSAGPQYNMALSRYLGPQMSMWTVNLWDPQYATLALSRCGALGVQTDNGPVEHSLACGALCESAGPLV